MYVTMLLTQTFHVPIRPLLSEILTVMNESDNNVIIIEIRRMVHEILGEIRQIKRHRNMLGGSPVLEFNEVCSMLHLSERQVRRLRESGLLVGFSYYRRRMYSLKEVTEFIAYMEREAKKNVENINQ